MLATLAVLVVAALLETGGDAAIRHGLVGGRWPWLLAGSAALVLYGFLVNTDRDIDFNRLLGGYIALFFVVSQLVAWVAFGERLSATLLVGGALVVAGGLVIQAGAP
jgi:drug/metabolite transporter superfamily protein YnfA